MNCLNWLRSIWVWVYENANICQYSVLESTQLDVALSGTGLSCAGQRSVWLSHCPAQSGAPYYYGQSSVWLSAVPYSAQLWIGVYEIFDIFDKLQTNFLNYFLLRISDPIGLNCLIVFFFLLFTVSLFFQACSLLAFSQWFISHSRL